MKSPGFRTWNALFLLLTASMYLGTGWSLWIFQFPSAASLTPENYWYAFVPQVHAATVFFTWMTALMLLSCIFMAVSEWTTGYRWVPIVVFLAVVLATVLTKLYIFPYNATMEAGIKSQALLTETLGKWITLNKVRVSLWTVEWAAMAAYVGLRLYREGPRPAGAEAPR
jgi:hypothetical protein